LSGLGSTASRLRVSGVILRTDGTCSLEVGRLAERGSKKE
jgi:hypothetical protein